MARDPATQFGGADIARARAADTAIGDDVGRRLKALYDAVETAPLPDIFLDLLEKLDAAEHHTAGRGTAD